VQELLICPVLCSHTVYLVYLMKSPSCMWDACCSFHRLAVWTSLQARWRLFCTHSCWFTCSYSVIPTWSPWRFMDCDLYRSNHWGPYCTWSNYSNPQLGSLRMTTQQCIPQKLEVTLHRVMRSCHVPQSPWHCPAFISLHAPLICLLNNTWFLPSHQPSHHMSLASACSPQTPLHSILYSMARSVFSKSLIAVLYHIYWFSLFLNFITSIKESHVKAWTLCLDIHLLIYPHRLFLSSNICSTRPWEHFRC
jgi:hypothetical protein